jgi:hypothetical protein
MARGTLIGESVRVGAVLEGVALRVDKVFRADVGDESVGQPGRWTFIEFEVPDQDAPTLAAALSGVLDPDIGWYCDFRTATETFVVFADRVFRYPRGNRASRAEVEDYGRRHGVPESHLDWPEE